MRASTSGVLVHPEHLSKVAVVADVSTFEPSSFPALSQVVLRNCLDHMEGSWEVFSRQNTPVASAVMSLTDVSPAHEKKTRHIQLETDSMKKKTLILRV